MISTIEKGMSVERVGTVERKQFTIAATPESFAILSNGLYSDKITAVLRELSTNALDSHCVAGVVDTPFDIHLPKMGEEYFYIRDYGTGLSHEDVMDLYTTYFGSNKRESNLLVGSLGLGSKSPLSLSRSFSVHSYFHGYCRSYVITLNENAFPEINYLPEQSGSTKEPNGLKIKFAVKEKDFVDFQNKALAVYQYFKVPPKQIASQLPSINTTLSGTGWSIVKGRIGQSGARLIMGSICYPINSTKISTLTEEEKNILAQNIEIVCDIGDVRFTPSREHLQYCNTTTTWIKAKLAEILSEIQQRIITKLAECKTLWDARVLSREMFYSQDAELKGLRNLARNLVYQNCNLGTEEVSVNSKMTLFAKLSKTSIYSYNSSNGILNRRVIDKVNSFTVSRIVPRAKCKFYEMDIENKRGVFSPIRKLVSNDSVKYAYVIEFEDNAAKQLFCKTIGINESDIIKVSSVPKEKIIRRHRDAVESLGNVLTFNYSRHGSTLRDYWKSGSIDKIDDGGIYVEVRNYHPIIEDKEISSFTLENLLCEMNKILGGTPITLYGVTSKVCKKFKVHPKWITLKEFIYEVILQKLKKEDYGQRFVDANAAYYIENLDHWEKIAGHCLKMGYNGVLADKFTKIAEAKKIVVRPLYSQLTTMINTIGFNLSSLYKSTFDPKEWKAEVSKLPLLNMWMKNSYCWHGGSPTEYLKAVYEYITLMENKNNV